MVGQCGLVIPIKSTDKQLLAFISDYCDKYGFSPSVRDISRHFGYSSPSTVHAKLVRLREMGLVAFNDGMMRTVRVVNHGEERRG